jgi:hypothetical protein
MDRYTADLGSRQNVKVKFGALGLHTKWIAYEVKKGATANSR